MAIYLVESYVARARAPDVEATAARAREAAEAMAREGTSIRYVRSTFLPDDEICLHVFEAASLEAAAEASRRAAIPSERIVEAVEAGQRPGTAAGLRRGGEPRVGGAEAPGGVR